MLSLTAARFIVALAAPLAPFATSAPADPVSDCVNGAPTIPADVSANPDAAHRLSLLSWQTSYADYANIVASVGPLAALDSIQARGDNLLAIAGDLSAVDAPRQALLRRLAIVRAEAASKTLDQIANGAVNVNALSVTPGRSGDDVLFVKDTDGVRSALTFAAANPVPAIALCAMARTTTNLFEAISRPGYRAVANEYATAVKHWQIYLDRGYSMTFVERLGNSCRLPKPIGWIVATTLYATHRCSDQPWTKLGPPIARTIFVHPAAGWAPVYDEQRAGQASSVVEWYGVLWSPFHKDTFLPFGVSFASMFPEVGTHQLGAVIHTPLGRAGVFKSGNSTVDRRGRIVLMLDATSWFPGNKASTAKDLLSLFGSKAFSALAAAAR